MVHSSLQSKLDWHFQIPVGIVYFLPPPALKSVTKFVFILDHKNCLTDTFDHVCDAKHMKMLNHDGFHASIVTFPSNLVS